MPTIALEILVPGVEQTEDFLVFYAESSQPGHEPYRVDMQKYCGNGECNCKGFTHSKSVKVAGDLKITKRQALQRGAIPSVELTCKHIRRVDRFINWKIKNAVIQERENAANQNKKAGSGGKNIPVPDRRSEPAGNGTASAQAGPGQSKSLGTEERFEDADCPL